jgi:hypothetical protein
MNEPVLCPGVCVTRGFPAIRWSKPGAALPPQADNTIYTVDLFNNPVGYFTSLLKNTDF